MQLTSMKTDTSEVDSYQPNPYGYGLCLQLSEDQCAALGIKTPPAAGAKVGIQAVAFVRSATQSVESDGDDAGPDVYLELQITDLGLSIGQTDNTASLLYGD